MAELLPINFPIIKDNDLINVDFRDAVTGLGYIYLDCTATTDKAATQYHLNGDITYTNPKLLDFPNANPVSFAIEIQRRITVVGKAIILGAHSWGCTGASSATFDAFVAKNDVTLGTVEAKDFTASGADFKQEHCILELDLPETNFNKGDTLTLSFKGSTAYTHYLWFDPTDTSDTRSIEGTSRTTTHTKSGIYLPVKV